MPFGFIVPKTLYYLAFQSFVLRVPDEGYSRKVSNEQAITTIFIQFILNNTYNEHN
jgi:hypothetical protein